MFKLERDVRRWLRKAEPDNLWWIESARGGTFGLPDALVARNGQALFLELKIAVRKECTGWVVDLALAQALAILDMRRAGLSAWIVAGLSGTARIGACSDLSRFKRLGKGGLGRGPWALEKWDLEWEAPKGLEPLWKADSEKSQK